MSLTKDDLLAIRSIVEDVVDDAKLQTAAGFAEVHEKFAGIDQKFDSIDQKFTRIDEKFDGIDQKFTRIDEKFDGIDQKFAELHGKIDNQSVELRAINDTVQRIEKIQQAEVDRVDEQSTTIAKIRKAMRAV